MPWWGTVLIGVGSAVVGVVAGCLTTFKIVMWICSEDDIKG